MRRSLWILGLALTAPLAAPAKAGVLATAAVKGGSFSARPQTNEPTPNYYGFGLGLGFGYSFSGAFDLALFTHYLPAKLESPRIGAEDASFFAYGVEGGLRLSKSVYAALRGGFGRYKLYHERRLEDGGELAGTWEGPAVGLSLGAIHPLNKQNFFQTSLDFMHAITGDNERAVEGKRRFDVIMISIAWVFIQNGSSLRDNTIFESFLNSIIFK